MSLTIAEFEGLILSLNEAESELDTAKKQVLEPLEDKVQTLKTKILQSLEDEGMDSFKSKYGTVTRVKTYTVTIPRDPEDKKRYLEFLREKGGEELAFANIQFNSKQVNALYKEQRELAMEEGNIDFQVPGVGEPKLFTHLSKRK